MKRYTINRHEITNCNAKLIEKKCSDYYPMPGNIFEPQKVYELVFLKEDKLSVSLEVSAFEYNVVEVGWEGKLIYQGYELISFGNWIQQSKKGD